MSRPILTLAVNHYDRYVPLLEGSVRPASFDLDFRHVNVRPSTPSAAGPYAVDRHVRVARGEFDIGEFSLASYAIRRAQGDRTLTAIPIFPRRLFSQSQIWVRDDGTVEAPADLAGRRVGVNALGTTPAVQTKGDLQTEYGLDWRSIKWVVTGDISIRGAAIATKAPEATSLGELLTAGTVDAVISPHPLKEAASAGSGLRRLFADPRREEAGYFARRRYIPIMHLITFRAAVVEQHPEAANSFFDAYAESDRLSASYYGDPNWSRLAWGLHYAEDERVRLGGNLWPNGLSANRANLESLLGYLEDQGLTGRRLLPEDLFEESMLSS